MRERGEKEGGAEDGDENDEKNEAEGKWSDARGSRIRREQGEERRAKKRERGRGRGNQ